MNILFIREFPLIDGTFTLIIRLAESIKKRGHHPYFLFLKNNIDQELLNKISGIAPVFYYHNLAQLKSLGKLPHIDVIHGILSGESLLNCYDTIKPGFFPSAGIVIGFYHPRTFILKTYFWPSFDTYIYKTLFSKIPAQNLTFMNSVVKSENERFFKLNFSKSPVIPLLVDVPTVFPGWRIINKNKLVSVGRLVYFKNYISPVIKLVAALNKKGYLFEYHIYGEGSLYTEIEALISKLNATSFVFLHGKIAYSQFNSVIKDALLFIGMGTSIIESSAQGVPSLQAIESFQHDATYGWFFNQEGYEVGEQIPAKSSSSYSSFILQAYHADEIEYEELCKKSWTKSLSFSEDIVAEQYCNFLKNADRDFSFIIPKWKKMLLKLARQPLKWKFLVEKK